MTWLLVELAGASKAATSAHMPNVSRHLKLTTFKKIYDIRRDPKRLVLIRNRTYENNSAGLGRQPANGITAGTPEWFDSIDKGQIPVSKIQGVISKVFMSGHNDFSEFEIESNGIKSRWTREGDKTKYIVGRQVILTYVEQKLRNGETSKYILNVQISYDETPFIGA